MKYSFAQIWRFAIGVIFIAIFSMASVAFYFAHSIQKTIRQDLTTCNTSFQQASKLVYEFSETKAEFYRLYLNQSTDIKPCIEHLNTIRQIMADAAFPGTLGDDFKKIIPHQEQLCRTMLYAFGATYFNDPTRDRAKESLENIVSAIREAKLKAVDYCQNLETTITSLMDELIARSEHEKRILYIVMLSGIASVAISIIVVNRTGHVRLQSIILAADNIRQENLAYRINMPFNDEIGKVAFSIDMMASQIQENEHQLQLTNKTLAKSLEDAKAADIAKSQFLANMSHEIRTPMNAIIGFTDILLEDAPSEPQREFLSIIKEASDSLLKIINDILDFSKIEAGKMELEITDCSLMELVRYIENLLSPAASKKQLRMETCLSDRLPKSFHADSLRIRQCLINLINNAIKFTQQGTITLSVSSEVQDGIESIRFDIIDTGIGIPKDKLEWIFKPFCQADGSMTRKFGGTGLGLSITSHFVKLMGGQISVQSELGKGSVFSILLPVIQVDKPIPSQTSAPALQEVC